MFGIKSFSLLLALAGVQLAVAQDPVYSLFFTNNAAVSLAGPLAVRDAQVLTGTLEQCYTHCSSFSDCLGFLAGKLRKPVLGYALETSAEHFDIIDINNSPGSVYCVALKYQVGGFTSVEAGYEFLGWRYVHWFLQWKVI